VQTSDYLVADSLGIQHYLKRKYNANSFYIPYGAHVFSQPEASVLNEFNLQPYGYDMLMARMEPENNIEIILKGVQEATNERTFLVIGNYKKRYGQYLFNKFNGGRIRFIGGLFDIGKLNHIRYFSNLYFHGHSVGGTNPSLLEAMASGALICAHRNDFNGSILEGEAYYFSDSGQVQQVLDTVTKAREAAKVSANIDKIRRLYRWELINQQYEQMMQECLKKGKRK
jgi:glycosyltransferase involved in cell wall biosynthesis